jgi:tetratricopeptide (TPR) repeat protein
MSGMILCRSEYSKVPYYIEGADVNVYSIEEISYFLYNDIYLVGADFFCEDLFVFIERSIKEPELAQRLRNLKERHAQLSELVLTVLGYVDFYSDREIEKIKELLERLDTQNPLERMKARADSYLKNKRYLRALNCYGNIVSGKPREIMPEDRVFWGNVLHNMGNAYVQMFDFEAAGACFEKAYELNGNEASEKCRQLAYELAKLSIDGQVDAAESLKDCEALAAEWKQEYLEYIR